MIEMHSAAESRMLFIGLFVYVLVSVLLTALVEYLTNKHKARKERKRADDQKQEMIVHVGHEEYYALAEKALEHQKMLEFKCQMNGFDKAIRILRNED